MPENQPPTDREQWFARQQEVEQDAQWEAMVQRGQLRGVEAAAFALAMWEGLATESFTQAERVVLVAAALRGR